uniref:Uncharacterized protein n=1 Tax=Arion vulgaris TaxID=1028688 RepID=A0A0B7A190_9EUPU
MYCAMHKLRSTCNNPSSKKCTLVPSSCKPTTFETQDNDLTFAVKKRCIAFLTKLDSPMLQEAVV